MSLCVTKEDLCKKVLNIYGVPVNRVVSIEGLLHKVILCYHSEFHNYHINNKVADFIKDISEMPLEFCLIKHLGQYDVAVVDAIQTVFSITDVAALLSETIMKEQNILMIGRLYSNLLDSSIKKAMDIKQFRQLMQNISNAVERIKDQIASERESTDCSRDEAMYQYLTQSLHFDFYFDFLAIKRHSYEFIQLVLGSETAIKVFRELLLLKKRAVKNQEHAWNQIYNTNKVAIDDVISWMGDYNKDITKEDMELKRLLFQVIIAK